MISEPDSKTIDALVRILRKSRSVLCITGAGVSAESGIPTYRGIVDSIMLIRLKSQIRWQCDRLKINPCETSVSMLWIIGGGCQPVRL